MTAAVDVGGKIESTLQATKDNLAEIARQVEEDKKIAEEKKKKAAYQKKHKNVIEIKKNIATFEEKIGLATKISDGVLTTRIIGEFSAGKSRLLGELFGTMIPDSLFPVSSLERQTRLQLEITHGEKPELTLIQRPQDYAPAVLVKTLSHFPEREELNEFDPLEYRLRLTLPETRLILENGDGFSEDNSPKRLFLIDTPGWNSGDDKLIEDEASTVITGYHNLALVYVCQASRLDGVTNKEHLKDFLSTLADADFLDQSKVIFILTHCPEQDAERLKKKSCDLITSLWNELDMDQDDLGSDVYCVDFGNMSEDILEQFRRDFWDSLLSPITKSIGVEQKEPLWVKEIKNWPDEWNIVPRINACHALLGLANNTLSLIQDEHVFIKDMNKYRLATCKTDDDVKLKVKQEWLRQFNSMTKFEFVSDVDNIGTLDVEHPLHDWWNTWLENCRNALHPVDDFFAKAIETIEALTMNDIDNIEDILHREFVSSYYLAKTTMYKSFVVFVNSAKTMPETLAIENKISTLLSLSLINAEYEDKFAVI